jgi:glutamine synthetase
VPKVEALDVWRILKGAGVRRLKFVIVDVYGKPRGVSLGIDEAKRALEEGVVFRRLLRGKVRLKCTRAT